MYSFGSSIVPFNLNRTDPGLDLGGERTPRRWSTRDFFDTESRVNLFPLLSFSRAIRPDDTSVIM